MALLYKVFFYTSIFFSLTAFSQNDDPCSVGGTHDLSLLPVPFQCPSPGFSDSISVTDNTANYTAENGRPSLLSCKSPSGNYDMDPSSHDTWYSFIASGNEVFIDIRPTTGQFLSNPVIGIYHYMGSCFNLIPMDCSKGSPLGQLHYQNANLIPYETYFIQVTGATSADAGNFLMNIKNRNTCLECMQDSYLDAFPKPLNGYYAPGTQVMFTYTVKGYKPYSGNALQAIIPQYGTGWDLSTLTTYPPQSVSGAGNWSYTTKIVNGTSYTGFFYQNSVIPGGDAGNQNSTWVFKWLVSTKTNCTSGYNLNTSILNFADKEINNQNTVCSIDPDYLFKSKINCCTPPIGVASTIAQNPTCNNSCNASIGISNTQAGNYTVIIIEQSSGAVIAANSPLLTGGPTFINGLCAGSYDIIYVDPSTTCSAMKNMIINAPVSYLISQTQQSCYGNCQNKASIGISGTGITHTWLNVPSTNSPGANNLIDLCHDSIYIVKITNSSCVFYDSIQIVGLPNDDATISYPSPACNQALINPYIVTPGGHFYSLTTPLMIDSINGVIDCSPGNPNNNLAPGSYDIMYVTKGTCLDSGYATVNITGLFNAQFSYAGNSFCKNLTQVLTMSGPVGGNYTYNTIPSGMSHVLNLNNINGAINPSLSDTGKYSITYYTTPLGAVVSPCDSYYTDTISINLKCDSTLHIFNVVTPNADGNNDFWKIDGIDGKENTVSIFNRWGMLIWERTNYNNEQNFWFGTDKNGKSLTEGTYYYFIRIKDEPNRKGWVELIR